MPKHKALLVFAIKAPFVIGVYEEYELIDTIISEEAKASDILPPLLCELCDKHLPDELFFVDGPGNLMSLKVAFVALKTISVLKNIPLAGADAFHFNGKKALKISNKLIFEKQNDKISLAKEACDTAEMSMPQRLKRQIFDTSATPRYILSAV